MVSKLPFAILISGAVLLVVSCSSTSKFFYKNNAYYKSGGVEKHETLIVDNVDRVTLDDTARAFALYSLKTDAGRIQDSLTAVFDYVLRGLTKKYIKKIHVTHSSRRTVADSAANDSLHSKSILLVAKDSASRVFVVPFKDALADTAKKKFNYSMRIQSPKVGMSTYAFPIFLPLPGIFFAASVSSHCFVLSGSYVLWDYDKDRAICAGEFSTQLVDMSSLLKRESLIEVFKPVVVKIFHDTPFPITSRR